MPQNRRTKNPRVAPWLTGPAFLLLCCFASASASDTIQSRNIHPVEQESISDDDMAPIFWNIPTKTIGGAQLWTDCYWRDGYRIQRNAWSGHYRLLDPKNVRRGWGTEAQCRQCLDEIYPAAKTGDQPRHYVILLHGLMRTSQSMRQFEETLRAETDLVPVRIGYASTRQSIAVDAQAVRTVMEGLPPNATFSIVAHSMGNIVARHMIADLQNSGDPLHILDRCHSMVMLGPPNQGASIARKLSPTKVFGWVVGPGGMELGVNWPLIQDHLATPPFPFMIIAGDKTLGGYANPLVDGTSDFIVGLNEATLEGAERLETVPVLHSFLMRDPDCIRRSIEFIATHVPTSRP